MSHASTTTRRAAEAYRARLRRALSGGAAAACLLAGAAHAAPDPLALCRELASWARAKAADPAVLALTANTPSGVHDPGAAFAGMFIPLPNANPGPRIQAAAFASFGSPWPSVVPTQTFGDGVWRAWIIEGTLECQTDHFFRFNQDGASAPMADVAAYSDLCWTSSRTLAMHQGHLALVETDTFDTPDLGADVEVTPWADGWGDPCRASLRYNDRFFVSERFCNGEPACGDAERLAPSLAAAFVRSPKGAAIAAVAPVDPVTSRELGPTLQAFARGGADGQDPAYGTSPPTFGAPLKTEYPLYSVSAAALVRLDDRPFLVRVGQGGMGWRTIGDYFVAFYSPDEHGLQPIASYVVGREATSVKSLNVSVPTPYVNPR